MKTKIIISIFLLCIFQLNISAQTAKEKAYENGKKAIKLEDEGKFEDAIKLLEEAKKLDPDNISYPYELGYTYYAMKEYKKAVKILEKIKKHTDSYDQVYQLLGNAYDDMGDSEKALKTYDEGLSQFPKSGKLYLEKGNVFWQKKDYNKAMPFYELGIEAEPQFSSNYYRAAILYCSSTEEVWGMIYGEIFMNLERNSKRTSEISKLLYNTYKSEIKFTSDSSYTVSFSKNATININNLTENKDDIRLPFGIGIYEPTLLISMINENNIDINSLDRIRKNFVENYYKKEFDKKYPNVLFDYQNKILREGHLEAYNHWILMKGDEEGFKKWNENNKEKWDNFVKWFTDNKIKLDDENKFYSKQYK